MVDFFDVSPKNDRASLNVKTPVTDRCDPEQSGFQLISSRSQPQMRHVIAHRSPHVYLLGKTKAIQFKHLGPRFPTVTSDVQP